MAAATAAEDEVSTTFPFDLVGEEKTGFNERTLMVWVGRWVCLVVIEINKALGGKKLKNFESKPTRPRAMMQLQCALEGCCCCWFVG